MSWVERKAAVPLRSPAAIAHIALTKGERTAHHLLTGRVHKEPNTRCCYY